MIEWFSSVWTIVLVALGIGGVIFVHECGHFFAARWCKVRVETFSLGFGPKIFGWTRGPTTYQLALLPLGGYVRMAGEEGVTDRTPAPDELPSKSVGQRFLIYSGGVLANVLLGLIVFPILFAYGVPFPEPVLGPSEPGSPAWQAGIVEGTRVRSVNGAEVISFLHIPTEVALGSPERAELVLVEPDGKERAVVLTPQYNETMGAYSIGVRPGVDPRGAIDVTAGSPAEKAGLREGDRLISVASPVDEVPGALLSLQERLIHAVANEAPVRAVFERDGKTFEAEIAPLAKTEEQPVLLGIRPLSAFVEHVIQDPLIERLGVQVGDRVLRVNGKPIAHSYDLLPAMLAGNGRVECQIERAHGVLALKLDSATPEDCVRLWRSIDLGANQQRTELAVSRGSAAESAGLKDGDRVLEVAGTNVATWQAVQDAIGKQKDKGEIDVVVERPATDASAAPERLTLHAKLAPMPLYEYGFALSAAQYVYRSKSPIAAVAQGWHASWKFIEEGWLTLKRIFNRQVSGDNIGGIITISVVSHRFAENGIVSLLFFLCMLSMNLAFLNVLPIPVLDGGHLFFLLVEKIKGSPVSEKVLGYSQMVGIVVLLSLMVYVTFKDVMRWIVKS